MALTLCPNCRLPVNTSLQRCPLCGVTRRSSTTRHVSLAAALAVVATAIALAARRAAS